MTIDRNDNLVRFVNTDGITYELWVKILNRFNYLGYELDLDHLMEYINRGTWLNEDQSFEVLKLLGMAHDVSDISQDEIDTYIEKTKEVFGTTNDLNLAGYILTDGSLLKLSYTGHIRDIDHREVKDVLTHISTDDDHAAAMTRFINYGNIRVMTRCLELTKRPTEKQKATITRFIRQAQISDYTYMAIDIANTSGDVVKTLEYDFPYACQVLSDIENYFTLIEI